MKKKYSILIYNLKTSEALKNALKLNYKYNIVKFSDNKFNVTLCVNRKILIVLQKRGKNMLLDL